MSCANEVLLNILSDQSNFNPKRAAAEAIRYLGPCELASIYVDGGFLHSFLDFLKEQHWLQKNENRNRGIDFSVFSRPFLNYEFSQRKYLHGFVENLSFESIRPASEKILILEQVVLELIKSQNSVEKKIFLETSLQLIAELFVYENQMMNEKHKQGLPMSLSLFRTYDSLDEVLGLNYRADHNMKTNLKNSERLYEGAGVGVQSGFSTALVALHHLNPSHGARFIDLGSGYGRIGLVVGLMRPDIDFFGYEYVQHRVDSSNTSAENLAIQDHVHFQTQDLSLKEFIIPDAGIYYLYDPFSEETYTHVLNQLIQISKRQKISIVTKGNARKWMMQVIQQEGWSPPAEFHTGNLCLFNSKVV